VSPELAAKTEHIGHGMVRLATGKMSSRTGDVIVASDFIDDVAASVRERVVSAGIAAPTDELIDVIAIAAIKYVTLKGGISQDTVFDKDKALSFEGDSGPYLQYTYARIVSVLARAKDAGVLPSWHVMPETIYGPERLLYRFESVVALALEERSPHYVTQYLTALASAFNQFYAHEKIANSHDTAAPYKAAVAQAVGQTLKNGLWVLGITAPEKM
jgi:arginyl-tRNA synthetase